MTCSGLNLTCGQPYYVTVCAHNEGGLWSESRVNNGVVAGIDTTYWSVVQARLAGGGGWARLTPTVMRQF
jgi:hypothetical protein